jgi:hypothetical protein
VIDERLIGERFRALAPELSERGRRIWAASEARALGRGGIAAVSRASGISPHTIRKAIREIDSDDRLESGRVRRRGAGRKPILLSPASRVPRLVRGWMDPRAGAGQGRMMYSWEAPERSRSALQAAAGAYDEIELRPADTIDTAASAVVSCPAGDDGDDDAPASVRERDRGDSADELDLDEAEALGELVELSPFWSGDPRDPGPEEPA